ncbi:hypothetical protein AK812_SmicGene25174 [Symbiodinium microadriaticum]|uniref:Uncharacterized protein n=1 Tax=Symbiodinium microadriaticum TaxID=2951 RepID=A0A1Q9DCR6_SYMMI|nr:hypothetical protein AK812_SmicGene25174 [Symbiodinium microadriaticum]
MFPLPCVGALCGRVSTDVPCETLAECGEAGIPTDDGPFKYIDGPEPGDRRPEWEMPRLRPLYFVGLSHWRPVPTFFITPEKGVKHQDVGLSLNITSTYSLHCSNPKKERQWRL